MFRFALAAGSAKLAAGARVTVDQEALQTETEDLETYCPSAYGFTVTQGKCAPDGAHIVNFANGEYANYGQDRNGGIRGLSDAARKCREHWDCVGFYTREGVGYSHYRNSITYVSPNPGHCCYQKSGSSLAEFSGETVDASESLVTLTPRYEGCYQITDEYSCLHSSDGRRDYRGQACTWCCGDHCAPGHNYRCQPRDWLLDPNQGPLLHSFITAGTNERCYGSLSEVSSETTNQLTPRYEGCYQITDEYSCLHSSDGRRDYRGQACTWCCGDHCAPGHNYRCQPRDWLLDPNQGPLLHSFITAGTNERCSGSLSEVSSETTNQLTTGYSRQCRRFTDGNSCQESYDHELGEPCDWCCGGRPAPMYEPEVYRHWSCEGCRSQSECSR